MGVLMPPIVTASVPGAYPGFPPNNGGVNPQGSAAAPASDGGPASSGGFVPGRSQPPGRGPAGLALEPPARSRPRAIELGYPCSVADRDHTRYVRYVNSLG